MGRKLGGYAPLGDGYAPLGAGTWVPI